MAAEQWQLTFRAEGDGPPTPARVRRLLKAALRCYGLRCVAACEVADDAQSDNSERAAKGGER